MTSSKRPTRLAAALVRSVASSCGANPTTATPLLRAGVDIHRVQQILRHKDVKLITETYNHLVVEDLRFVTLLLPEPAEPKNKGPDAKDFSNNVRASISRGDRI